MRTRSNTRGSLRLQSKTVNLQKSRPKSTSDSTVVHVKMKAKKSKTTSRNPHPKSLKQGKNSVTSESQSGKDIARNGQLLSSDGLLMMKLQQEAGPNLTRLIDKDGDSESSGDEELPAIFDPSAPESRVLELASGTVVWAKSSRWSHWPAVLCNFYCNKKKAWVEYFEDRQRVQVSSKSLVPFTGLNRSKYIDLGRQHKSYDIEFEKALEKADDYLIKRGLGKSCDSNTSFHSELDTSFHSPPTSPQSEPQCPISPCRTSEHNYAMSSDQSATPNDVQSNLLSSDDELRVGFPLQSSCPANSGESPQEDPSLIKRQKRWIRTQNRLLEYILKKTTENHLLAIYHSRTKSERHSLFVSKRTDDQKKLRSLAGLGPFTEDEQQGQLTRFLNNLYMKHCMESKEDLPSLVYITEVWLPEAVIYAMQKTRRISRVKAEKLFFTEGVQSLLDLGEDIPTRSETLDTL